ncbi:hypothetical protein BH24ACT3_BH24ACT3_16470 [soil metagenome]
MALQGTLDTFALPDVLRLLASTAKTGELQVNGSRGNGSVWVDAGRVVATEASGARHAATAAEVVFELLRYPDGSFVFVADADPATRGEETDVGPLLDDAQAMLDEWREIEAAVPALSSWVNLAPRLPADEVTVDPDVWRMIVAVGAGETVARLGDRLELGEMSMARNLKGLVEAGLVEIGEPMTDEEISARERLDLLASAYVPSTEPAKPEPASTEPASTEPADLELAMLEPIADEQPDLAPIDDLVVAHPVDEAPGDLSQGDLPMLPALTAEDRPVHPVDELLHADADALSAPVDEPVAHQDRAARTVDQEVARQLSALSPEAARAVAAAAAGAGVGTGAPDLGDALDAHHGDPHPDETGSLTEDPAPPERENAGRGLLSKFLTSGRP